MYICDERASEETKSVGGVVSRNGRWYLRSEGWMAE